MLLWLFALFCFILFVYWNFHCQPRRHLWAMAKALPGPPPVPILGNLWLLRHGPSKFLHVLMCLFKDYGPLVRLWAGDKVLVLLCNPDDIQQVLGKTKLRNRPKIFTSSLAPLVGNGLLTTRDDTWKSHRKIVTPLFHFKILESYVEIFGEKASILVERLSDVADGRSFDVYKYLCYSTLESICETAIGVTVDKHGPGFSEFPHHIETGSKISYSLVQLHWLLPEWLHWMICLGPHGTQSAKHVRTFCVEIIAKKLDDYRRGVRRSGVTTSTGKTISSFLDMLIDASETQGTLLTPQEMQDEVIILAIAGMETTATTMAFMLLLVAIHPDIQKQIVDELTGIFGSDPRTATTEDLADMHLLERVVKETLRLFPVAPITVREIPEDVTLTSGHALPRGCSVGALVYAVHRNEDIYTEPNRFWPDRWLPENSTNRHPYAFLPFGAGLRNCIGQKYAMLQMKATLSTLLRQYEVTTHYKMADLKKLDLSVLLALSSKDKYSIMLKKRIMF